MTTATTTINPTTITSPTVNVISVTVEQLRDLLLAMSGCMFASIEADYDMVANKGKLLKGHPFTNGCRKIATTSVMVNFDYDKSVKTRTDGEESAKGTGTYQQALIVNGRITPLSTHKDDVLAYAEDGSVKRVIPNARVYLRSEFRSSESYYVDNDGNPIDSDIVKPYLPKRKPSGVVNFHLVTLNNITAIRIAGNHYRIIK